MPREPRVGVDETTRLPANLDVSGLCRVRDFITWVITNGHHGTRKISRTFCELQASMTWRKRGVFARDNALLRERKGEVEDCLTIPQGKAKFT